MRSKIMSIDEFRGILERNWIPVELIGEARPSWMHNIPENIIHSVYASGSGISIPRPNIYPLPAGDLIGGIDIYRNAPNDPVKFNKDWYAVITDSEHDDMLLVCGPYRDNEHWIDEIPERLKGAEIFIVPPRNRI